MVGQKEFERRKEVVLKALASDEKDNSRKGGVDAPIADLIFRINSHPWYFTTSSCSGRISLFLEDTPADAPMDGDDLKGKKPSRGKKGGDWVFVSHERVEVDEVVDAVRKKYENTRQEGLLVFRFEPFILVLECCSLSAAQQLVTCAHSSGYRESGMLSMHKRFMVGVRSSIRLEVPIGEHGQLLVSDKYLTYLIVAANKKFVLNQERIDRFLSAFDKQINDAERLSSDSRSASMVKSEQSNGRHERKREAGPDIQSRLLLNLEKRQLKILSKVKNLEAQTMEEHASISEDSSTIQLKLVRTPLPTKGQTAAMGTFKEIRGSGKEESVTWVLKVEKNKAKVCKDALKQLQWLDSSKKPKVFPFNTHVAFPVLELAIPFLGKGGLDIQIYSSFQNTARGICSDLLGGFEDEPRANLLRNLCSCGGEVLMLEMLAKTMPPRSPLDTLRIGVSALLQQNGLHPALLEDLPKRWERLGDLIILPMGSLCGSAWSSLGEQLWRTIAFSLKGSRVARQARIAPTGTRDSRLQLLYGTNGWVEHKENGILYCFDATKCMFSSGNVSEKLRIASLPCRGATVVDLFAGIGYYVIPFLLLAGAEKVYACEWNPHAIVALRYNLHVNGVEDRCEVLEGDNRKIAPEVRNGKSF